MISPEELIARAPVKFKVSEEFYCKATQSRYLPELSYTIRAPDTVLARYVSMWLRQGIARIEPDAGEPPADSLASGAMKVSGTGVVA